MRLESAKSGFWNNNNLASSTLKKISILEKEIEIIEEKQEEEKNIVEIQQKLVEINLIVNKDNTVIGGHQRLKVCKELKYVDVDCVMLDLSKEEERELIEELKVDIAADNTPARRIPLIPIGK